MLANLINITSSEPYKSHGVLRVKNITINPWESPDVKFTLEIYIDTFDKSHFESWEIVCNNLAQPNGIPLALVPRTEMKVLSNHPLLWELDDKIYFSLKSNTQEISALIGDLFIKHSEACGGWIDFEWLYGGLPEILLNFQDNQFAIPIKLKEACFDVLEKYGIQYTVNEIQKGQKDYFVLFFSNSNIWPDEKNFKQPYIIAKKFLEEKIG